MEYKTSHKCITIDVLFNHATINRSDQCNLIFLNMKQKGHKQFMHVAP